MPNQLCVMPVLMMRLMCFGPAAHFCWRNTEVAFESRRKIGGMAIATGMGCLLNTIAFFQVAVGLLKPTVA